MHSFRRKRALLRALHARIEVPFRPLVERGRTARTEGGANQRRRQDQITHRTLPTHQEAYERGQNDEKRKSGLDQFGKVADQGVPTRYAEGCRLHAMRSIKPRFTASGKTKSRIRAPQKSRKASKAPTSRESAPSAMWALATSAALSDQIVQAPSPI